MKIQIDNTNTKKYFNYKFSCDVCDQETYIRFDWRICGVCKKDICDKCIKYKRLDNAFCEECYNVHIKPFVDKSKEIDDKVRELETERENIYNKINKEWNEYIKENKIDCELKIVVEYIFPLY